MCQNCLRRLEFHLVMINQHTNYRMWKRSLLYIQTNTLFCGKYKLAVSEDQNLPIMYWIPKMHKNSVGTRFIVASSKCST